VRIEGCCGSTKGRHCWLRGSFKFSSFKQGFQVRGVGLRYFYLCCYYCMIGWLFGCMNCDKTMQFHVFGNFPETTLRAIKAARRPIPFLIVSGFHMRNRLAVRSWSPGDTCANLVSGFLMNCLAMMNFRQATWVNLTRFWCFRVSRRILIGEKTVITACEWLEVRIRWSIWNWRFDLMKDCMNMILGLMIRDSQSCTKLSGSC